MMRRTNKVKEAHRRLQQEVHTFVTQPPAGLEPIAARVAAVWKQQPRWLRTPAALADISKRVFDTVDPVHSRLQGRAAQLQRTVNLSTEDQSTAIALLAIELDFGTTSVERLTAEIQEFHRITPQVQKLGLLVDAAAEGLMVASEHGAEPPISPPDGPPPDRSPYLAG